MKFHEIKDIKQKLRQNETPSEKKLWKYIRKRQLGGRKFIRQHAVIHDSNNGEYFFYIPDFYCEAELLAVELDGKIHEFRKAKDKNRDETLKELGIKVLRFKNEELEEIETVLDKITNSFRRDDNDEVFMRKCYRNRRDSSPLSLSAAPLIREPDKRRMR